MSEKTLGKIIKDYEIPGTREYSRDGSGTFSYYGAWVVKMKDRIQVDYLAGYAGENKRFPLDSVPADWERWIREKAEAVLQEKIPGLKPWYGADHYRWRCRTYIRELYVARGLLALLDHPAGQLELFGGGSKWERV